MRGFRFWFGFNYWYFLQEDDLLAPDVTYQSIGVSWQGDENVTWQDAA